MTFLLIGDPHFRIDNAYECNQFIEEIYKLVNKNKYSKIIILGDILDTHEKINLRPFHRAVEFIINLSLISKTYLLIGNHDRINNDIYLTDEHPFLSLKKVKNIVVVDKVIKEKNILYVPYVPTGRFNEALKTVQYQENEIDLIFCHQEFKNSIFQDQGDEIPKNVKIYSGHIHNSVRLNNLFYIGTPFQHSYYDNEDKFILELNKKNIEKKVYLEIIKKRFQEIIISQLLDYKVDENYITKLLIKGDRKLLNNNKIQEILKHPKIKYKINYKKEIKENKENKEIKEIKEIKYFDLLNLRLKKESKEVQNLYKKINKI